MAQRKTKSGNIPLFIIGAAIFSGSIYFHCFSGQDTAKSFLEDKGYTQVKVSSGNIFKKVQKQKKNHLWFFLWCLMQDSNPRQRILGTPVLPLN